MIGVSYNVTSIGEGGGVEETVLKLLSVRIIILYEVVLEIKDSKNTLLYTEIINRN
jgi:hypothetical protein